MLKTPRSPETPDSPCTTKAKDHVADGRHVRMEDVAREAGVSRQTVSKVLFPDGFSNVRVGERTVAKVRLIAERMGYLPNLNARQLTKGNSYLIGVLIDSFASEISYRILRTLERKMAIRGYRLLVGQMHDDVDAIRSYVRDFAGRGVEGVISFAHGYPGQGAEVYEPSRYIDRVIYMNARIEAANLSANVANVYFDLSDGIEVMVRHLWERGARKVALLLSGRGYSVDSDRQSGFFKATQELGAQKGDALVEYILSDQREEITSERLEQAVSRILEAQPEIEAILTVNDLIALQLIGILEKRGKRVPQDVKIAGANNMGFSEFSRPSITTLDYRLEDVSSAVVRLMLDTPKGEDFSRPVGLSPKLIVRESTQ